MDQGDPAALSKHWRQEKHTWETKTVMLRMLRLIGGGAGEVGMGQTGHVDDFELNSKDDKEQIWI